LTRSSQESFRRLPKSFQVTIYLTCRQTAAEEPRGAPKISHGAPEEILGPQNRIRKGLEEFTRGSAELRKGFRDGRIRCSRNLLKYNENDSLLKLRRKVGNSDLLRKGFQARRKGARRIREQVKR